ncbi:hypothetical protein ACOMHN_017316 [Nucella lapillus]
MADTDQPTKANSKLPKKSEIPPRLRHRSRCSESENGVTAEPGDHDHHHGNPSVATVQSEETRGKADGMGPEPTVNSSSARPQSGHSLPRDGSKSREPARKPYSSVLSLLGFELTRGYYLAADETHYEERRERVYTFMSTPLELEKFCMFGVLQCVDTFLFFAAFLPIRIVIAMVHLLSYPCVVVVGCFSGEALCCMSVSQVKALCCVSVSQVRCCAACQFQHCAACQFLSFGIVLCVSFSGEGVVLPVSFSGEGVVLCVSFNVVLRVSFSGEALCCVSVSQFLSFGIVLCVSFSGEGVVLCVSFSGEGVVLCVSFSGEGVVLCVSFSGEGVVLCVSFSGEGVVLCVSFSGEGVLRVSFSVSQVGRVVLCVSFSGEGVVLHVIFSVVLCVSFSGEGVVLHVIFSVVLCVSFSGEGVVLHVIFSVVLCVSFSGEGVVLHVIFSVVLCVSFSGEGVVLHVIFSVVLCVSFSGEGVVLHVIFSVVMCVSFSGEGVVLHVIFSVVLCVSFSGEGVVLHVIFSVVLCVSFSGEGVVLHVIFSVVLCVSFSGEGVVLCVSFSGGPKKGGKRRRLLQPAQVCDLLKGLLLGVAVLCVEFIDTSRLYHMVRGQAVIKLYVFYNMLDLADRLVSGAGQDMLDALYWTATEPGRKSRRCMLVALHFGLALLYILIHTVLILGQATVLNVAFNSHNKALLTIMISNNFVEIKASLFKRMDLNNLQQISCSDVKERFHYSVLLFVVFVRNMTEFQWNTDQMWAILQDTLYVGFAEVVVDWVKHAFITKFNEIPSKTYRTFKINLAQDILTSQEKYAHTDYSDQVCRRLGMTPIPLVCLLIQVCSKSVPVTGPFTCLLLGLVFLGLVTTKVLTSILLLGWGCSLLEGAEEEGRQTNPCTVDSQVLAKKNPAKDAAPPRDRHPSEKTSPQKCPPPQHRHHHPPSPADLPFNTSGETPTAAEMQIAVETLAGDLFPVSGGEVEEDAGWGPRGVGHSVVERQPQVSEESSPLEAAWKVQLFTASDEWGEAESADSDCDFHASLDDLASGQGSREASGTPLVDYDDEKKYK